jgi:hypothetical protein
MPLKIIASHVYTSTLSFPNHDNVQVVVIIFFPIVPGDFDTRYVVDVLSNPQVEDVGHETGQYTPSEPPQQTPRPEDRRPALITYAFPASQLKQSPQLATQGPSVGLLPFTYATGNILSQEEVDCLVWVFLHYHGPRKLVSRANKMFSMRNPSTCPWHVGETQRS